MNRRQLKKHFNALVEKFADDCLELESKKPAAANDINALLDGAAELLDDVMHEISVTSQYVGKEVKHHYNKIWKNFETRLEELETKKSAL